MSQYPQHPQQQSRPWEMGYQTAEGSTFNFFNVVYAWMAVGLALTAVVGYFVAHTQPLLQAIYGSGPFVIVAIFLGLAGLSWFIQSNITRISTGAATSLFLLYAAVLGAALSGIFIIYSTSTLLAAFAVTGGVFGIMSVYGFVTRTDLTRIGSIAIMGAIGLFVASLVNIFMASNMLSWIITYGVVIVFTVITAYETQALKMMAMQLQHDPRMASRIAIVGSLVLYISFMNLFISILRIMGDRR